MSALLVHSTITKTKQNKKPHKPYSGDTTHSCLCDVQHE